MLDDDEIFSSKKGNQKDLNSTIIKPSDMTTDTVSTTNIKYLKDNIKQILNHYIETIKVTPLDKFELDLLRITKAHIDRLYRKSISIKCIKYLHHVTKALSEQASLKNTKLEQRLLSITAKYPYITSEYEIFSNLLPILNGLLVKWEIVSIRDYDYRYSGRTLNVKMLNLIEMNSEIMTIDIFWISSNIKSEIFQPILTPSLIELSKVLDDQVKICFNTFLRLNIEMLDTVNQTDLEVSNRKNFSQKENSIKITSEIFPEEKLVSVRRFGLKIITGFKRCYKKETPELKQAFTCLAELEYVYRCFEKQLVASILRASGHAEF